MKSETKNKMIMIRGTAEEKAFVEQCAKDNHFASVSAFVLWLVKKYGKKE